MTTRQAVVLIGVLAGLTVHAADTGNLKPGSTRSDVYPLSPVQLKTPGPLGTLKDLARSRSGAMVTEPVGPDQAFRVHVRAPSRDALTVTFDIADCCYLYRERTKFALVEPNGTAPPNGAGIRQVALPRGAMKQDEFVGASEVYRNGLEVRLPLTGIVDAAELALDVTYQGCAEKGVTICYAPTTKRFPFSVSTGGIAVAAATTIDNVPAPVATPAPGTTAAAGGKFWWTVFTAFGVGLLLTFTPCVLPMIPILSSMIVGGASRDITKLEGGLMSLSYVLGTAVTYTAVGVIAGATGDHFQSYFQNPWAIGLFAVLFATLAASMFGLYDLQLPAFIQSRLHHHSHRVHARTRHVSGVAYAGVFIVGLLSALIVGACVSPLLISVLVVAIANKDPMLGGAVMFSMALGMGVILIGIGIGAGLVLPKAGPWMHRIKHVFGALLLAVAIYILGALPEVPVLFLWALLLIVSAIYLGATQGLPRGANGWQYLWKGLGTFLLAWGVVALLGGLAGHRDILRPLPLSWSIGGVGALAPQESESPLFTRVDTAEELDNRLDAARAAGKPVMLDYYATWCTDCVHMEQSTLRDPRVRQWLQSRFVTLQADVTDSGSSQTRALKQRFGVYGPPAMLFFGASGQEKNDLRVYGYRSVDEMLAILAQVDPR